MANFALEVDALAANFTHYSFAFVAGKFFGRQINFYPLQREKIIIRDFAVGEHLLLILVGDFWMHSPGESFRRFFGGDADGVAVSEVDECRCDLAPVAELESALAETAASDHGNGVGGAAVDFDEGDQAFAVFSARVVYAEFVQAQHGEADAEYLSGAKMAVGLFGVEEKFVERLHGELSAVSCQSLG